MENFLDIINGDHSCDDMCQISSFQHGIDLLQHFGQADILGLPAKDHMADRILLEKVNEFHMAFVSAASQPTMGVSSLKCI